MATGVTSESFFTDNINSLPQFTATDQENLEKCLKTCRKIDVAVFQWLILVNTQSQTLHLLNQEATIQSYWVSTSAKGVGQEEGSGKTPLGLHVVENKIGDGANSLAIFESRQNTGKVAVIDDGTAAIVGRILRLQGLETHYNSGKNLDGVVVDSFDRYIYIHGTNDLKNLGKPVSGGCVRMSPGDMVDIYDHVPEKTPVFIY